MAVCAAVLSSPARATLTFPYHALIHLVVGMCTRVTGERVGKGNRGLCVELLLAAGHLLGQSSGVRGEEDEPQRVPVIACLYCLWQCNARQRAILCASVAPAKRVFDFQCQWASST